MNNETPSCPASTRARRVGDGHAVDSYGNAVADPSLNVGALVEAEGRRQDDLRTAEARRADDLRTAHEELDSAKHLHAKEMADLRSKHAEQFSRMESGRVDSLRQGDREETTRATVAAQANISALANTTTTLADTLRNQVASTAAAAENRQSAYSADVGKRLTAVELSLSEGKGKEQVSDPAMERLAALVERLASGQQVASGVKQGMSDGVKLVIALLTLVSLFLGFMTYTNSQQPTPPAQVVYVPAPVTPPAVVPR